MATFEELEKQYGSSQPAPVTKQRSQDPFAALEAQYGAKAQAGPTVDAQLRAAGDVLKGPQGQTPKTLNPFVTGPRRYYETMSHVKELDQMALDFLEKPGLANKAKGIGAEAWSVLEHIWAIPDAVINSLISKPLDAATGHWIPEQVTDIAAGIMLPGGPTKLAGKALKSIRGTELGKGVESLLSPSTVSAEAGKAASLTRAGTGTAKQQIAAMAGTLETGRKALNTELTDAERIYFMRYMDGDPEAAALPKAWSQDVRDAAKIMRQANERMTNELLKRGLLTHAYSRYWGRILKDPDIEKNPRYSEAFLGSLTASKSFLRHREYQFLQDAIDAGLVPATTDPVKMFMSKYNEMAKFIQMDDVIVAAKRAGLVVEVAARDLAPEGMVPLKGALGERVYRSPKKEWNIISVAERVAKREKQNLERIAAEEGEATSIKGPTGFVPGRMMRYMYATPEVARIFNTLVEKGMSGNALYKSARAISNSMTQIQLAIPTFHGIMVTLETSISDLARGLKKVVEEGKPTVSLVRPFIPGASAVHMYREGKKLLKGWETPLQNITDPRLRSAVKALQRAGADFGLAREYRGSAAENLWKAYKAGHFRNSIKESFKNDGFIKGTLDTLARAIDTVASPIMEHYVPRLKAGAFAQRAFDELAKNPNADMATFQRIWDSIDNRFGEVVHDNIFWHRAFKDAMFLTVRSVGWNLGTIREIGGGLADASKIIQSGYKNRAFTDRMAYTSAMVFPIAIMGGVLTYMLTGKPPTSALDYIYPPTGERRPDGSQERLQIPSYIKDVVGFARAPLSTLSGKESPLIAETLTQLANKDFWGGPVVIPGDPFWEQLADRVAHVFDSIVPIAVERAGQISAKKQSALPTALGYAGFGPAPYYIINPQRAQHYEDFYRQLAIKKRMKEERKRGQ